MSTTQEQPNKPLSVSQAMALAKGALESLTVTLIGEVSEVSNKPGYKAVYFTLKDEQSTLPAMMWMNRFHAADVDLRVGLLVQVTGRFTVYAPKGRMNFDVFTLSPAGEGDLRQKVADLARKLKAEGLMDAQRKRPLPTYPLDIGVVTSPRGAAVHDVLRTLRRRFPLARVLFAGVGVEGAHAAEDLANALTLIARSGAEVVLLVRGGGSFEDLMPFNDETLARTIASLPIPVVTGIGHEPDTSIADMVADVRASTPTAAAESVAPDVADISAALDAARVWCNSIVQNEVTHARTAHDSIASRPVFADPAQIFSTDAQTLDVMGDRLQTAIPNSLAHDRSHVELAATRLRLSGVGLLEPYQSRLDAVHDRARAVGGHILDVPVSSLASSAARLEDLSPLSVLSRGFALAKDEAGALVKSVNDVAVGEHISLEVADGVIGCAVENTQFKDRDFLNLKG